MKSFEVLGHAADIDIIVHSEKLKALFENAVRSGMGDHPRNINRM